MNRKEMQEKIDSLQKQIDRIESYIGSPVYPIEESSNNWHMPPHFVSCGEIERLILKHLGLIVSEQNCEQKFILISLENKQ